MAAAACGHPDVVQEFIRAKANLNARSKANVLGEGKLSALHCAVRLGHYRIVRTLLEAGADVDPVDQSGCTPLVIVCFGGTLDLVRLLLDHGANPNGCNQRMATPLTAVAAESTVALTEKREGRLGISLEIGRELLRRGADPNLQAAGQAPLHSTASVALARELIAAGANINERNAKGETPLIVWATAGSMELLRCYVRAGADVNAVAESGETALMRIFDRRPPEIQLLEMLVGAGADIHAVDKGGNNLLDYYEAWFERIVSARKSDALRALFKEDDYVDERARLIGFLKERGARNRLQRRRPTTAPGKGTQE